MGSGRCKNCWGRVQDVAKKRCVCEGMRREGGLNGC
jgi:hypothetical protein